VVKVTFKHPDGTSTSIEAEAGDTLMTAATANLLPGIIGDCGGGMTCATCHVFVDEAWRDQVGPPQDGEAEMLEMTAVEAESSSRLSCQIQLDERLSGLVVGVPECQE
jgi:ferredoxin, 2Fe-2S